jgi:hypothetical protein
MIKPKAETKVVKDDSKKIRDAMKKLNGSYVTIGFHQDAGQYEDGTSVVSVALWNEFGTQHSPERSFFRSAINDNQTKINEWREEAIRNITEKGWTVKKALEMIGFRIQVLIQNKIKSNVPPPNAPSTIQAKQRAGVSPKSGFKKGFEGRTGTLINTGLMLRSVTFRTHVK